MVWAVWSAVPRASTASTVPPLKILSYCCHFRKMQPKALNMQKEKAPNTHSHPRPETKLSQTKLSQKQSIKVQKAWKANIGRFMLLSRFHGSDMRDTDVHLICFYRKLATDLMISLPRSHTAPWAGPGGVVGKPIKLGFSVYG